MAKAASVRIRPACDQDSRICAAVSAPSPYSAATRPGGRPFCPVVIAHYLLYRLLVRALLSPG
jgi:hypothetical protein